MDETPRVTIDFAVKGADPNNPPMPETCGVCCKRLSEHTEEMKEACFREVMQKAE